MQAIKAHTHKEALLQQNDDQNKILAQLATVKHGQQQQTHSTRQQKFMTTSQYVSTTRETGLKKNVNWMHLWKNIDKDILQCPQPLGIYLTAHNKSQAQRLNIIRVQ